MRKSPFSSKKAITQADWAISLGIFIIYLVGVFLLAQPFLRTETHYDSQLDNIYNYLEDNIIQEIPLIPFVITAPNTTTQVALVKSLHNNNLFNLKDNETKGIMFYQRTQNGTSPVNFLIYKNYLISQVPVINKSVLYLERETINSEKEELNEQLNYSHYKNTYNRTKESETLIIDQNNVKNPVQNYRFEFDSYIHNEMERNGNYIIKKNTLLINNETLENDRNSFGDYYFVSRHTSTQNESIIGNTYKPEINVHQFVFSHKPELKVIINPKINTGQTYYTTKRINNETKIIEKTYNFSLQLTLTNFSQYQTYSLIKQSYQSSCKVITAKELFLSNNDNTIYFEFKKLAHFSFCDLGSETELNISMEQNLKDDIYYTIIVDDNEANITSELPYSINQYFPKTRKLLNIQKAKILALTDYSSIKQQMRVSRKHNFNINIYKRLFETNTSSNESYVSYDYIATIGKDAVSYSNVYSKERQFTFMNDSYEDETALINVQFW